MSVIACAICNKIFTRQHSLDYHIANNACDGKIYDHECEYCNKRYTSQNSLYRHIRTTCKTKKEEDDEKHAVYDRLEKLENRNERLEMEVIKLKKKKHMDAGMRITNNIGTINNNINNGTINNITIVAYGKEDMLSIDREEIIRALKTGFNSTKLLTEVVHFNPKYPNYSNIKRSNFNMKNKIMYHNGGKWVTTSDPHMIDDLYNRKRDFIEENIEHYRDGLTKGDMTRIQRWLNIDDDDNRITRIKGELRELLFNRKDVSEMNERQLDVNIVCVEDIDSHDDNSAYIEDIIDDKSESDSSYTTCITKHSGISIKIKKKKLAPRNGKYRKAIARRSN
jgi:Zinc finger, C2H2 type/Zinc-finger of C2H2 type